MKKHIFAVIILLFFVPVPLFADECMEGDCEDGVGVGFTDNGKIFQGQWHEGMPHGKGKLLVSKGKYIEGIWENGELIEEGPNK